MITLLAYSQTPGLWDIAEQVPAPVVLLRLVSWFLKYLQEGRDFQETLSSKFEVVIKENQEMMLGLSNTLGQSIAMINRIKELRDDK